MVKTDDLGENLQNLSYLIPLALISLNLASPVKVMLRYAKKNMIQRCCRGTPTMHVLLCFYQFSLHFYVTIFQHSRYFQKIWNDLMFSLKRKNIIQNTTRIESFTYILIEILHFLLNATFMETTIFQNFHDALGP